MECNDNRGRIALARRYYLHLSSGAPIVASDMGRVIEGMEQMDAEIARLRRALDLLGVPAQATKDPDKAAPLRITVEIAKRAMEVVDG